jgi:hypothetical protein
MFMRLVIYFVLLLAAASVAHAHPLDGVVPGEAFDCYGQPVYPAEADLGDLIFSYDFTPAYDLSHAERHMAFRPDGYPSSWIEQVWKYTAAYFSHTGDIPAQFDPSMGSVFRMDGSPIPTDEAEYLKSPVNGQSPRLDAQGFSPGDLYIRALTPAEVAHFAQYDPLLKTVYETGAMQNPDTGLEKEVQSASKVFYVRGYGETGVVFAQLLYSFALPK